MHPQTQTSHLTLNDVAERLGGWAATAERQAAATGSDSAVRYSTTAGKFRELQAAIVAALAQQPVAKRATKARSIMGAEAFFDTFQAARRRVCELHGDRWVVAGLSRWATVPAGLRSFKGPMGTTIRLPRDIRLPPADCWVGGVIPAGSVPTNPVPLYKARALHPTVFRGAGYADGHNPLAPVPLAEG